jgi:hypothetical protein
VGAQVPLVLALDDPGAEPGVVGGKGASLARLARAGFRVPPGFHVTTGAYLDFMARSGLREPVLAAMAAVDASDAATFDAAAVRIGELFAGQPLPATTAAAIAGAYGGLGSDVPVAVQSSATVEDTNPACPLPGSTTRTSTSGTRWPCSTRSSGAGHRSGRRGPSVTALATTSSLTR